MLSKHAPNITGIDSIPHPCHLFVAIKAGGRLIQGQKVWEFSDGKSYIAEDVQRGDEYVIRRGQLINPADHADQLIKIF